MVCSEAVARGFDEVSNDQSKCADASAGITAFKTNFGEIHISRAIP